MKQKDVVLIIVVVFVSSLFSLVFSSLVISSSKNRREKVEVVDAITDEFQKPDTKYFNEQSIDPTKLIQIGDNQNPQPFNGN